MPTFHFRWKNDLAALQTIRTTAPTLNQARDTAVVQNPRFERVYDETYWPAWECWEGGKCLWHYDLTGDIHDGPRQEVEDQKQNIC